MLYSDHCSHLLHSHSVALGPETTRQYTAGVFKSHHTFNSYKHPKLQLDTEQFLDMYKFTSLETLIGG